MALPVSRKVVLSRPGSRSVAAPAAPLGLSARAILFQELYSQTEEDELPRTKWGRCSRKNCRYALAPHMFASGRHKGSIRLLCGGFFKQDEHGDRFNFAGIPFLCPLSDGMSFLVSCARSTLSYLPHCGGTLSVWACLRCLERLP